jgi:hypothetical protein
MMIVVAVVAVYLALLTSPIGLWVGLATGPLIGPLIGAVIDRRMKGPGVAGGMLGGVAGFWGFGAIEYFWEPPPKPVSYLVLKNAFVVLSGCGLATGAMVGIVVWVAALGPWLPVELDPPEPE